MHFFCTLCLKMDAYFQDVFELTPLNTAAWIHDTAFCSQFDLIKSDGKFGYMRLVK